jgi:hypothetical protein
MDNDTYVIVVFYSLVYILLCFILFIRDLQLQYDRMIRFAFC